MKRLLTIIPKKLRDSLLKVKRSYKWRSTRNNHLKLNPTCEACGRKTNLTVHHKVPVHIDPTRELDPANLKTLCEFPSLNCHFTFGHLGDWASYNTHVDEDCTLFLQRIKGRP